jgi:hypothetical protein
MVSIADEKTTGLVPPCKFPLPVAFLIKTPLPYRPISDRLAHVERVKAIATVVFIVYLGVCQGATRVANSRQVFEKMTSFPTSLSHPLAIQFISSEKAVSSKCLCVNCDSATDRWLGPTPPVFGYILGIAG